MAADASGAPIRLRVGETATRSLLVDESLIAAFADVTGDHNPVHLDDEHAATTRFGKRVAHGMIAAGLISATLGNDLPGPGTVYLSQSLRFIAPVFPGDTITASVSITSIRADKPLVTLATTCTNQLGVVVTDGEALVLVGE